MIETVLVFVGIPAAVIAVVAGLVYGASARRGKRYRPGRPFQYTAVWFLSSPEGLTGDREGLAGDRDTRPALPAGSAAPATEAPVKGVTSGDW